MKRLKQYLHMGYWLFMIAVALLVFSVLPPEAIGGIIVLISVGVVIQALGETTTTADHLVRDVSDALTYIDEVRDVPLDQILRRMRRRKKAENVVVEWATVERTPPRQDTSSALTTAGGAGAAKDVVVDNASMWRRNDLVLLRDNATTPNQLLLVDAVDTGTSTLTVYALVHEGTKANARTGSAFGTVPAIAADEILIRLSTSKTESDTPSDPRQTQPTYDFNFVHTFDGVVEVSDHRMRTKNYTTVNDWARARETGLIDFRRSCEVNYFFGDRTATIDPQNSEVRWTMGGLIRYSPTQIDYTIGAVTEANVIDWQVEIFTGNTGRSDRLLFGDKRFCADLDKVFLANERHAPNRKVAGVMMSEMSTRHGRQLVVHHPLFDRFGYENFAISVDISAISKVELQALQRRVLDYKGSGGRDAEAEQYIEKSTLEVANPATIFTLVGS